MNLFSHWLGQQYSWDTFDGGWTFFSGGSLRGVWLKGAWIRLKLETGIRGVKSPKIDLIQTPLRLPLILACFLHDGPMSFAICRATLYCHTSVVQLWSSLSKAKGVATSSAVWCSSDPCQVASSCHASAGPPTLPILGDDIIFENNPDHPHPPYLQKRCPKICHTMGVRTAEKSLEVQGMSTENMANGPQNMASEFPPCYAIWTVFIRGGGGLYFVEFFRQKCGSEIFLRFSLPKVSWNFAWNFSEIFCATFPRIWVCDGKFHQNFTSKAVWKTENFTPISLCWGAALRHFSEDFSLLVTFLLVTFSWLFRGFFVAFSWPSSA